MLKTTLIISSLTLILSSCSTPEKSFKKKTLRQRLTMGTVISLQLMRSDKSLFEPSFQIFNDLDKKLSTYKKKSEVSIFNSGVKTQLSEDTLQLLKISENVNSISEGFFNIYTAKQTFLSRKSKANLFLKPMKVSSQKKYIKNNNTYKLTYNHKVDFGGIAKGYAVDKTLEFLKTKGVKYAQVSASGDIGCLGPCKVYIQNPVDENPMIELTSLKERFAISTSGNYRRKTLSHIINPKSGKFVNHWLSVTLIDDKNNTVLDGLTTAIFSMPRKKAFSFLKRNKIQYIIVDQYKKVYISDQIGLVTDDLKFLSIKDLKITNRLNVKAN